MAYDCPVQKLTGTLTKQHLVNFCSYQNWYDARASCAGRGGRLATIYTLEENQIVGRLAPVSYKFHWVMQKKFEGSTPTNFFNSNSQRQFVSWYML